MPIVLESNQNHATAKETEVCTTLPASMGLGGGYVPMIIQKVYDPSRRHDYEEWEDVCGTLENRMGTGGATCRL